MLPVVDAIGEKANSQSSVSPMVLVAVWADDGPEDRLITDYRMRGTKDTASPTDTNVAINDAGSLTIAPGAAVALDTSTAQASGNAGVQYWQGTVTDLFSIVWA